jgi:YceI-like domain
MRVQRLLCGSLVVASLWLTACHSPPPAYPAAASAAAGPAKAGASLAAPARVHYLIDPQRSEVLVLVYRDGPMGHLGHNHVVAVRNLSGDIGLSADPLQSTFSLAFPVDALSVDEPLLRAREGDDFHTTLDEAAIAGTRDHMLGAALLDAAEFRTIELKSGQLRQADDGLHIVTAMTVHGLTAQVDVPVASWHTDEREVRASGEFDLTHTQLGLTPYSIALGALRVADRMHVRYQLVAAIP